MPTDRAVILDRIAAERTRQERHWSCQNDERGRWALPEAMKLAVLAEEVGEVARALNDGAANELRDELVQVAAVCSRWLGDKTSGYNAEEGSLQQLIYLLGESVFGEKWPLPAIFWTCVAWLERFDDDPIVDAEKRRVREGSTNAWRPAKTEAEDSCTCDTINGHDQTCAVRRLAEGGL